MKKIPLNLYYAWLGAPTEEQRWEVTQEINKKLEGDLYKLAIQTFEYENSTGFFELEKMLRKVWIKIAVLIKKIA